MKNTYRFFVEPEVLQGSPIQIDSRDLVRQWSSVLRLRPGQQLVLLDGSGDECLVELTSLEKHSASARLIARTAATGEPQIQVTLYVALTRGERFEWVLQKGTELGAAAFVPLICERSITSEAKQERWGRIIREAAEQSARARLPQLHQPLRFSKAIAELDHGLFLTEHSSTVSLKRALADQPAGAIAVLSGPEGGWTDDEIGQAHGAKLAMVTLGPRILRAETAPLAAISAIMFASDEWQSKISVI